MLGLLYSYDFDCEKHHETPLWPLVSFMMIKR